MTEAVIILAAGGFVAWLAYAYTKVLDKFCPTDKVWFRNARREGMEPTTERLWSISLRNKAGEKMGELKIVRRRENGYDEIMVLVGEEDKPNESECVYSFLVT